MALLFDASEAVRLPLMVRELAFVNAGGVWDAASFAFAVEAVRIQLHRDFLPAWRDYLPVKRPVEVVGYSDTKDLAPGSFAPILVMKSLGRDGFVGDHGGLEITDTAYGRTQPESTIASHEAIEMVADPFGNRWVRLPSGLMVAFEVADMVENDRYTITASIGGATRDVEVSNFAYPAWFGEGTGKFDHMGLCTAPEENRGYLIVANDDGTTSNVFASTASTEYRARVEAKRSDHLSRTAKRHALTDDRTFAFGLAALRA